MLPEEVRTLRRTGLLATGLLVLCTACSEPTVALAQGLLPYRVVLVGDVPAVNRQWFESVVTQSHKVVSEAGFAQMSFPVDAAPTIWIFADAERERFFQEMVRTGVVSWSIEEVRQRFAQTAILTSSLTLTMYVRANAESVQPGTRYSLAKEASRLLGQYTLSGRDGIRALMWLREGHTELYAARTIEASGSTPYAENRRGAIDNARRFLAAGGPISLGDLEAPEQWSAAQDARRLRVYGIAWLAYEHLEQRFSREKAKEYFGAFRTSTERGNFERAFGVSPDAFYRNFSDHLRGLLQ